MRIGLDARFLTHPQAGGFKTYTTSLLTALSQIDQQNEYFIYVDRTIPEDINLPKNPNITYKVVPGTLPLVGMPLREQFGLRSQLKRDEIDLFHFPCNTATIALSVPYVVTLHDTIQVTAQGRASSWKRWAQTIYAQQVIAHATCRAKHIITVSDFVKNEIHNALGIPKEKITVTYQGVNPRFSPIIDNQKSRLAAEIEYRLGVQGPYILGVGYEDRKNIPLLIDVFAQLAKSNSELKLVIVAANECKRTSFQNLASNLGIASRTVVLGKIPFDDLLLVYGLADLFAFPSDQEGYGLPPLEAMACGVPTVAMNCSSIPEVVRDGAVLVDGAEIGTWVDTIRFLIESKKERLVLRERGLSRVAALSWRECAEETLSVYHSVIQQEQQRTIAPLAARPANSL